MKLVIVVVLACIYLQVKPISAQRWTTTPQTTTTTTTPTPTTTTPTTTTTKSTTTTTTPTTTTTTPTTTTTKTTTTTTTPPTTTTTTPTTTTTTPTTTTTTPTTTTTTPTTTTTTPTTTTTTPTTTTTKSTTTTTPKTTTTTTPKTTTTTTPKTTTTTTKSTTTTTTPTSTTTTPKTTTTTTTPTTTTIPTTTTTKTTTTSPTTTTTTPTTTTTTPTTTTLCPLASSRVVIISDYPPQIPDQNCIGSCSYYDNTKYMSVSDLGLTMSDTLIVIAGPNSTPNTASSMIDYWQYIYYLTLTTKTYFFTYPVDPISGDPNGAIAISNYNLLNQIPTISSAANVEDYAAYIALNSNGDPCSYFAAAVPTTPPTTTTSTSTTTTGPTTTTAVGSCVTSTSRIVIISDYPPQIASPNCVGSCSYYDNSEYMNVFNLNLGMSDILVIIAGPYSTPNTASSIIDYWQFIYLLGQTTKTYFFTYPVPNSGDPNGAIAISNYNILNQVPTISYSVTVEDFAAYIAANSGGNPCDYLASIGVSN